jgi:hypothetical protein
MAINFAEWLTAEPTVRREILSAQLAKDAEARKAYRMMRDMFAGTPEDFPETDAAIFAANATGGSITSCSRCGGWAMGECDGEDSDNTCDAVHDLR